MQIAALPLEHQFTVIDFVPYDDKRTLQRLALVSSNWRGEAEKRLYRSALLSTPRQAITFFEALHQRDFERCKYVRGVRIDPWDDLPSARTCRFCKEAISRCTRLEVLRISSSFPFNEDDPSYPCSPPTSPPPPSPSPLCIFPHLKNIELSGTLAFQAPPFIRRLYELNPTINYTRLIHRSSLRRVMRYGFLVPPTLRIQQIQSDAPSVLSWGETPSSVERLTLGERSFIQLLVLGDKLINLQQAELNWPAPGSGGGRELESLHLLVKNHAGRKKLQDIRTMKSLKTIIVYLPLTAKTSQPKTWEDVVEAIRDLFFVFPNLVNLILTGPRLPLTLTTLEEEERKAVVESEEVREAERRLSVDLRGDSCPSLERITLAPLFREWAKSGQDGWRDIEEHGYAESIDDPEWACYRELEKT